TSQEAIKAYFEFLFYTLKGEGSLDKKKILHDIENNLLHFKSIAEKFHIIEDYNYTVYVPLSNGEKLVSELKRSGQSRKLLRQLGKYSVGVSPYYFRTLLEYGAIERISENAAILCDVSLYNHKMGLSFDVDGGKAHIT
ncbi:MAG: CRISPR-associated helicase/endonuclease Cas3, partial [Clostridiales bacterium]|nr:CRISPR-associated helicase/endonuclease Cas3 [Clostridiales bacterium]